MMTVDVGGYSIGFSTLGEVHDLICARVRSIHAEMHVLQSELSALEDVLGTVRHVGHVVSPEFVSEYEKVLRERGMTS